MNKLFMILVIVFGCTGCVTESQCISLKTNLSIKHEEQLYEDLQKDKRGFIKIIRQFEDELGTHEEAYSVLTSGTIGEKEKRNILNKYGPLLLNIAVFSSQREKVVFYLENGVDSLKYNKYIGIIVIDLAGSRDFTILEVFREYFNKNNIRSPIFEEIESFYDKCA